MFLKYFLFLIFLFLKTNLLFSQGYIEDTTINMPINGKANDPSGIAVDKAGNIYVRDSQSSYIISLIVPESIFQISLLVKLQFLRLQDSAILQSVLPILFISTIQIVLRLENLTLMGI